MRGKEKKMITTSFTKEKTMKQRGIFPRSLAIFCCLLLGILLLLSACSNSSKPGSQPGGSPSNGGYSIIQLFDKESQFFHNLSGR